MNDQRIADATDRILGSHIEESLLRIADVQARTGLGRSALYERVAKGTFPAPLKRGAASIWIKSEVDAWVLAEIAELPRMGQSMGRRETATKKAA